MVMEMKQDSEIVELTKESENIEQRHISKELPEQSRMSLRLFAKKILKNQAGFKTLLFMDPGEERYVRPPREYEIPPFRKDMQYCTSNEKYLKPTRWCNPREPEVVAIANELGAYELSDYEFAEAAYWWVKTKLTNEMLPLNRVSTTLKRGTGTCFHLSSVWIALCRAAGIKARYKSFNMLLPDHLVTTDPEKKNEMSTGNMFNNGTPEGEVEVLIDGTWIVGHVAMRPELLARCHLPINRFGEDAIDLIFKLIPGTIKRYESIPFDMGIRMKVLMSLFPAAMERADLVILKEMREGKEIIEEVGGWEAYDRTAREKIGRSLQTVEPEDHEALVFIDR